MKQRRYHEALWLIVLPLALITASALGAPREQTVLPYNVILLTPDQMRADYMHTYDYPLKDTPNIDRFAHAGTVFLHAYSSGAWTTPSFGTIMTGLFPTVHGMTLPPYEGCGPSIARPLTNGIIPHIPPNLALSSHKPILPELLQAHGVVTGADVANCWAILNFVSRGWNALKYFPQYQLPEAGHPGSTVFRLTAPDTTKWAQGWLTSHRNERFFLWVHYMEPHAPYNAPHQYDIFKEPDDFPNLFDDGGKGSKELRRLGRLGDEPAIRRLQQLYAAKILYVDHYIGELINTVQTLQLEKNTLIVFVSDHGQLLYSHPEDFNTDGHCSLYSADLHVPLIFWGPGIPAGKRVKELAGHYDILPTILDLENLPIPSFADGKSLKPVILGKTKQVHHYIYSEESAFVPQYSARDTRYKIIETMRTGAIQCFDEVGDPNELRSICSQIPQQEVAQLKAAVDEHIKAMISQAKGYPDWRTNFAVAMLEQRDSEELNALAPRKLVVFPQDEGEFQLTGRLWSVLQEADSGKPDVVLAPPGADTAYAIWRSETPLIGEYEVSIRYGYQGMTLPGERLATNADYVVRFKGGSLSFPADQNEEQGQWIKLGHFRDPISVELTNRADGLVIAGDARFIRLRP
ncbi:MAG: sulfatase-like hydrolase/transferase [Acidobacteriaceae bacterium]